MTFCQQFPEKYLTMRYSYSGNSSSAAPAWTPSLPKLSSQRSNRLCRLTSSWTAVPTRRQPRPLASQRSFSCPHLSGSSDSKYSSAGVEFLTGLVYCLISAGRAQWTDLPYNLLIGTCPWASRSKEEKINLLGGKYGVVYSKKIETGRAFTGISVHAWVVKLSLAMRRHISLARGLFLVYHYHIPIPS